MRHFVLLTTLALFAAALPARAEDAAPPVHTIDITAGRFAYSPNHLEVEQGEHVILRFHSMDVEHGFRLDAFSVKTVIPNSGEVVSVEFDADKAGTFEFSCTQYCGSGHTDMHGILLVRGPGGAVPPAAGATSAGEPDFELVTLPTTAHLPRHRLAFRVTHRFTRPLGDGDFSDLLSDFFGFDSSAQIGIGLRYGLTNTTQLGFYRTNDRDIQLFARQEIAHESDAFPLSALLVGSVEGENNFGLSSGEADDEYSPAVALVLSRSLGTRAVVYAVPAFVGNTNLHPARPGVDNNSLLVGLGARLRVSKKMFLAAEVSPHLAGFRGTRGDGTKSAPLIGFGLERQVGGHLFQIDFQNALGTTPAQVARAQDNVGNDWFLGFRIARKFY